MEGNNQKCSDHEHKEGEEHKHNEKKQTLCVAQLQFESFATNGWTFNHSSYPMFSAKQLDQISDVVGTMGMPEVFYGFNHLYISNPDKDILLEFSPVPALSLSAFAFQKDMLKGSDSASTLSDRLEKQMILSPEQKQLLEDDRQLNLVDITPNPLVVKEAAIWKKKDMSKIKDFKQIEIISDWTYSTPYKGNVFKLSRHGRRIQLETSLQLTSQHNHDQIALKIDDSDPSLEIPLTRLGRDNPILHFAELYLYESDLDDQGYCADTLRFRVMSDCFYVLHRFYLRVDEVLVRIYDTRIFHSYDQSFILREFQYKENTYDELRAKGVKLGSEWALSKSAADEIFPQLALKKRTIDKIIIGNK